jgi:uncharacterized protein (DUF2147 family)
MRTGTLSDVPSLGEMDPTQFGSRTMRLLLTVPLILLTAFAGAMAQPSGDSQVDPTGEWLVAKRVARIKIVNCNERLWGVVSWETTPGVDSNNPDPAKRTRPTLGMPILLGMEKVKSNEWKGEIYNSEDGKTYSSSITLLNPDLLKVQGCVLGILCGGENWTRVTTTTGAPSTSKSTGKSKSAPRPDDAICLSLTAPAGSSH